MPHEPGHNGQYVIKSTGEPYNGPVLKTWRENLNIIDLCITLFGPQPTDPAKDY